MRPLVGASVLDIDAIVRNLSAQNRAEADVLHLTDALIVGTLAKLARLGYSEVGLHEGQPVAALGFNISPDGKFADTWFISTDRLFSLGIGGLRFSREVVKRFREIATVPLRSTSYSPLPEAAKWFLMLGFKEMPDPRVDGSRVFVYN